MTAVELADSTRFSGDLCLQSLGLGQCRKSEAIIRSLDLGLAHRLCPHHARIRRLPREALVAYTSLRMAGNRGWTYRGTAVRRASLPNVARLRHMRD